MIIKLFKYIEKSFTLKTLKKHFKQSQSHISLKKFI